MESSAHVELVFVTPGQQWSRRLPLAPAQTVEELIQLSGLLDAFPELALATLKVGIFGRRCTLAACPGDGDRIEIYRPLINDPKAARKQRAATGH